MKIPWKPQSQLPALFGAAGLVWLAWDSVLVTPLKILTVFFHEISHGLAAMATGGRITSLTFHSNQGGLAHAAGGSSFLMLNAGYLGSLAWGCGLILLSSYTRRDRAVSAALGATLGVITVLYVRNAFGFAFGLAAAGAFLAAAAKLSESTNDFLIKVVGVTSALYVIPDVYSDVVLRSCWSDATMLAEKTGVPRLQHLLRDLDPRTETSLDLKLLEEDLEKDLRAQAFLRQDHGLSGQLQKRDLADQKNALGELAGSDAETGEYLIMLGMTGILQRAHEGDIQPIFADQAVQF